jgi:HEPN domain-containing protein
MSGKASGSNPVQPSDLVEASIKAIEVATDSYSEGTPKRYESCVENCDKAVELILKAKVIDVGESIYYPGSTNTIKMHESFAKLRSKGIVISEENTLINNHKLSRNPTYHEGRTVPQAETKSILDTTIKFLERFLNDEFNLKLREKINHVYLQLLDNKATKNRQGFMIVSTAVNKVYKIADGRIDIPKDYDEIEFF